MTWIETLLHLSPDGGSGASELVFAGGLLGIATVLAITLLRWMRDDPNAE